MSEHLKTIKMHTKINIDVLPQKYENYSWVSLTLRYFYEVIDNDSIEPYSFWTTSDNGHGCNLPCGLCIFYFQSTNICEVSLIFTSVYLHYIYDLQRSYILDPVVDLDTR